MVTTGYPQFPQSLGLQGLVHYIIKILNVIGQPFKVNTIQKFEFHNYQQDFIENINYNDEVRNRILGSNSYIPPCDHYNNTLENSMGRRPKKIKFINNGVSFLLRELIYDLNRIDINS